MVLLLLVLFYGNHCFIFQRKGLKISTYLENSSEVLTTWLFLSVLWVFKSLFLQLLLLRSLGDIVIWYLSLLNQNLIKGLFMQNSTTQSQMVTVR